MTIHQNTAYVLQHPFLREAIERFQQGDCSALAFVLDSLQEDMYHKTLPHAVKTYRRFRWENAPVIEEAIRCVPPPENLSVRLPIPEVVCLVVPMQGVVLNKISL